jgi:hypothetical protein
MVRHQCRSRRMARLPTVGIVGSVKSPRQPEAQVFAFSYRGESKHQQIWA